MLSSRIVITVTLVFLCGCRPRSLSVQRSRRAGRKLLPPVAQGQAPSKNIPPLLQQYDFGGQLPDSGGFRQFACHDVRHEFAHAWRDEWRRTERLPAKSGCATDGDSARSRPSERAAGKERRTRHRPVLDGRVMYSYGAGLPTIVCAPLRIVHDRATGG